MVVRHVSSLRWIIHRHGSSTAVFAIAVLICLLSSQIYHLGEGQVFQQLNGGQEDVALVRKMRQTGRPNLKRAEEPVNHLLKPLLRNTVPTTPLAVKGMSEERSATDIGKEAKNTTGMNAFNSTNPHSSWCPKAHCHNSPQCSPCNRRFLIELTTGRSGSTSLMNMLDTLPGIRMSGENNNALGHIHNLMAGVFVKNLLPMQKPTDVEGPWKHGRFNRMDMACPGQKFMESMNPPKAQDQTGYNDDSSTIIGFKTIRLDDWGNNYTKFVPFLRKYFPCSRVVINIRSDTERQINSQNSMFLAHDRKTRERMELINTRLREIFTLLGDETAYFLDNSEWGYSSTGAPPEEQDQQVNWHGVGIINNMVHWLGYRNCTFDRLLVDHTKGYNRDEEGKNKINLGPHCHNYEPSLAGRK